MDYKIKTGARETITTTRRSHSYFEVSKGVFAFKLTANTISDNPHVEDHSYVLQGLMKRDGITALNKGLQPNSIRGVCVAPPVTFEAIRRFGYSALTDRGLGSHRDLFREDIYDYLVDGGDVEHVIRIEHSDHSFWRVDGSPLPTGIYFDYISARMHNRAYDLHKALEILAKRGDVTFIDPDKHAYKPLLEKVIEPTILKVPYYNADTASAYLAFFWTPDQEQAELIGGDSVKRFKTIFDADILGLRAGGAALFDDFHKSVERQSSDYDDED